jgi:hypothetical protein
MFRKRKVFLGFLFLVAALAAISVIYIYGAETLADTADLRQEEQGPVL